MDKLRALKYFKRVVEENSFSRVAEEFSVPPSSISRRIKDLETELGIELIKRSTRQVKTTELGKVYYEQIANALQIIDEAEEFVLHKKEAMSGTLRLSVTASFGQYVIADVLSKFRSLYPDIRLELDFSDEVVNLVDNSVDIAIRAGSTTQDRVIAKPLSNAKFKLVCTPELLSSLKAQFNIDRFSINTISKCPSLLYRHNHNPLPWWSETVDGWIQVKSLPTFSTNNSEMLLEAACNGEGIALFPLWLVEEHLNTGTLIEIPTESPVTGAQTDGLDIYIIYQHAKYQIPKVRTCIDFILQHF